MKRVVHFLFIIFLSSCLFNDKLNIRFDSIEPIEIGDGHELSNPAVENIDPETLNEIYRHVNKDDNLWSIRSLLVFRNGKLLSEAYFKDDEDINTRHLIWSCTKQVMGVLIGMAVDQGLIKSIDDPISDYLYTELIDHPDKQNITIRNLLTMQSGIGYSNDGVNGQTDKILRQLPENIVEFILGRPMDAEPGSKFYYKDGDPQLLAALIQKVVGKPTDVWADEVLFSKIGVNNLNWVRYKDGTTFGGFGIETTPRELAKIALFVSDSGNADGQQILSKEWISNMTQKQVETNGIYDFGYYWWIDPTKDIHFMWGHGGQFAFIVPSKKLVVMITSIPNTQGRYQILADEALPIVYDIMKISK